MEFHVILPAELLEAAGVNLADPSRDVSMLLALEVVDGSDVRMIEGRENLSLTLETSHVVGIVRERSGEDFDRYVASEFRVPGAVDFAHAACPDRCKNLVRPQDGFRPREAW